MKVLGPASDLDDAARARFHREIAALGQIDHPNLVKLIDHGIDPELGPYLVLPLLAGTNLRSLCSGRLLSRSGAAVDRSRSSHATAALHAHGYVHRDLKPENAIAAPDGTITVIDLGLAWREGMTRHTDTGAAVGSVGYMAPEQIEGRAVDDRADVWALGVMIYELIAGKRPFARPRPAEEAAAALLGACPKLTAADRRGERAALASWSRAASRSIRRSARPPQSSRLRSTAMIDWTDDVSCRARRRRRRSAAATKRASRRFACVASSGWRAKRSTRTHRSSRSRIAIAASRTRPTTPRCSRSSRAPKSGTPSRPEPVTPNCPRDARCGRGSSPRASIVAGVARRREAVRVAPRQIRGLDLQLQPSRQSRRHH